MISFSKKIFRLFAAGLFLASASACSDDNINIGNPSPDGTPGYITFRCADMVQVYQGANNYASRASAPKEPREKEIKTLHVFFFNPDDEGKLLKASYENFPAYRKISNRDKDGNEKPVNLSLLKIPAGDSLGNLFEGVKTVHIVAIANIDATDDASNPYDEANSFYTERYSKGGKIQKESRAAGGVPYEITCYDDLTKWVYYPSLRINEETGEGDISKLPVAGMPMIGEATIDISTKPADNNQLIVNMTALMAKVNVSVKLESSQTEKTDEGRELPELKITEYGVRNMPVAVPFEQPDGKFKGEETESLASSATTESYLLNYNVTQVSMVHRSDVENNTTGDHTNCAPAAHEYTTRTGLPVTINDDSDPVTFSYYTYENINLPNYSAKRKSINAEGVEVETNAFTDDFKPQYHSKVDSTAYQRWKPTIAHTDRASALILKGEYITHQEMHYQAQFTIYLGGTENNHYNFKVERNKQYDNNIIIKGLEYIRNSDDNVYTFDARVNVVDDNPFYLAIVNERKVDAHATALPMDIWLMLRENGDGTIIEDENRDWHTEINFKIRDAEKNNWIRMELIPRETMEAGNFKAGTGARDYFTTNLVTSTLAANTEIKFKGEYGSRSRIYFYIDENVPANNNVNTTDPNASNYYGDRKATIDIEYVRFNDDRTDTLDHRIRTLDIEQRALLRVNSWTSDEADRNGNYETAAINGWMEYYEEYLDHNDPLDMHDQPGEYYTGLHWGLWGVRAAGYFTTSWHYNRVYYTSEAFDVTKWAINQSSSMSDVKIFNSTPPASAFHYCYGKNKRNANGSVPTATIGWYMPGIRELEAALVEHYKDFPEFRNDDYLYWSASSGDEPGMSNNTNNIARATGVTISGTGANVKTTYVKSKNNGERGHQSRRNFNRIRAFYKTLDN